MAEAAARADPTSPVRRKHLKALGKRMGWQGGNLADFVAGIIDLSPAPPSCSPSDGDKAAPGPPCSNLSTAVVHGELRAAVEATKGCTEAEQYASSLQRFVAQRTDARAGAVLPEAVALGLDIAIVFLDLWLLVLAPEAAIVARKRKRGADDGAAGEHAKRRRVEPPRANRKVATLPASTPHVETILRPLGASWQDVQRMLGEGEALCQRLLELTAGGGGRRGGGGAGAARPTDRDNLELARAWVAQWHAICISAVVSTQEREREKYNRTNWRTGEALPSLCPVPGLARKALK